MVGFDETKKTAESEDEYQDNIHKQNYGGYGYWKRDIGYTDAFLTTQPGRITDSPVILAHGASAWNASGTWEERDVSVKTSSYLNDKLKDKLIVLRNGDLDLEMRVIEIDVTSCEASVCYVRGQARFGYEVELHLTLKGGGMGSVLTSDVGHHIVVVNVEELNDHSSDFDLKFIKEQDDSTMKVLLKKELGRMLKLSMEEIGKLMTIG